jgi:hypothetical protein
MEALKNTAIIGVGGLLGLICSVNFYKEYKYNGIKHNYDLLSGDFSTNLKRHKESPRVDYLEKL